MICFRKVVRAFLPAIIGITGRNARATFFLGRHRATTVFTARGARGLTI